MHNNVGLHYKNHHTSNGDLSEADSCEETMMLQLKETAGSTSPVLNGHQSPNPYRKESRNNGMPFLKVRDEFSYMCGLRVRNMLFVNQLASVQLVISAVSLAQHIYSLIFYHNIFKCTFDEKDMNETSAFLQHDVIIFDFGLFHTLVPKVTKCIANYLDGGYMRCMWCVWQLTCIVMILVIPCIPTPHPLYMYPILIMQNSYCFGLVILSIATADKMVHSLMDATRDTRLTVLICVFYAGTASNYLMCYVLWHYHWFLEAEYKRQHPHCRQTWL